MVRFEFTLSDVDAENLIGILRDEQERSRAKAREYLSEDMTDVDQANVKWYTAHADYLEELRQRVLGGNTRVVSVL